MNGVPDHHAWGMSGSLAWIQEVKSSIRLPKAPKLLSIEEAKAQGAGAGTIGFALNGVSIYKPYNSSCCDAVYARALRMNKLKVVPIRYIDTFGSISSSVEPWSEESYVQWIIAWLIQGLEIIIIIFSHMDQNMMAV